MSERRLRMVIAGGGTGGHVLPALAVIEELRRRDRLGDALWIGSHAGLEGEAAAGAGIPFHAIRTGKLRRYIAAETAIDATRIPRGIWEAWRALRTFRPDLVFSTGGFVSVPTVVAAARSVPVLTHEQTAILGLATRINARFADLLAVSYEATAPAASKRNRRVVVTGNPVRASLANGDASRGRDRWGFTSDLPMIYVTGGARGASPLNQRIAALLPDLLQRCQILHQTGPGSANMDAADLERTRETWPQELRDRYRIMPFIGDELADVYAAVDLIVGRAGAGTVAELAFLGKPAILIPLPGTGGDEQTHNARLLVDAGAAVVLSQPVATPERLRKVLDRLLADLDGLARMGERARAVGRPDASARLADELLALSGLRNS